MKNTILYNYNLNDISITIVKNNALVKDKEEMYLFQKVEDAKEVEKQYNLTKNNKDYFTFVINKEKSIFTKYKDAYYVLLQIKEHNKFEEKLLNPPKVQTDEIRKSWIDLWMEKGDFIEYQMMHISGKYKSIDESVDYYIGLLEVAIAYLKYNIKKQDNVNYLVHKRINKKDFFNPLNVTIDVKERDIAGYLKYLFLNDQYKEDDIKKFLRSLNLDKESRIRLLARMLYPSHYFDLYDKVVSGEEDEEIIKKVVIRTTEYENYLKIIFDSLNQKKDLPYIHFL